MKTLLRASSPTAGVAASTRQFHADVEVRERRKTKSLATKNYLVALLASQEYGPQYVSFKHPTLSHESNYSKSTQIRAPIFDLVARYYFCWSNFVLLFQR